MLHLVYPPQEPLDSTKERRVWEWLWGIEATQVFAKTSQAVSMPQVTGGLER